MGRAFYTTTHLNGLRKTEGIVLKLYQCVLLSSPIVRTCLINCSGSTGTSPGSSNPGSNAQPQVLGQPMGGLKSVSMNHHSARMNRVQQSGHPYARPTQGTVSCPLDGMTHSSVISNI